MDIFLVLKLLRQNFCLFFLLFFLLTSSILYLSDWNSVSLSLLLSFPVFLSSSCYTFSFNEITRNDLRGKGRHATSGSMRRWAEWWCQEKGEKKKIEEKEGKKKIEEKVKRGKKKKWKKESGENEKISDAKIAKTWGWKKMKVCYYYMARSIWL